MNTSSTIISINFQKEFIFFREIDEEIALNPFAQARSEFELEMASQRSLNFTRSTGEDEESKFK
jgi:hypothetical protein